VSDVHLRPARQAEAADVAEVFLRSFHTALPTVHLAHTDDEVRAWYTTEVLPDPERETWVAVAADGRLLIGMMVLGRTMLEQLYLLPEARGAGIGDRFIAIAKERRPEGFQLYAFQVNGPACRFYERHGLVAVEYGDGSGNQEHEPDVRYAWTPG
jgi:GNAT superfamily N-acetyltransferase